MTLFEKASLPITLNDLNVISVNVKATLAQASQGLQPTLALVECGHTCVVYAIDFCLLATPARRDSIE